MNNPASDAGIPLLTEILVVPPSALKPDVAANYAAEMVPVVPVTSTVAVESHDYVDFDIPALMPDHRPEPTSTSEPTLPIGALLAEDWQQLQTDITERISRQVLNRIDFVLEQRVRDSLADVLQIAVEGLAQEIKRGLHHTLEDVIGRAVAQELARLQKSKN